MAIQFMERHEDETRTEITIDVSLSGVVISEGARTPKRRPWVVTGPWRGELRTYSTLDKAATEFFKRLSLMVSMAIET